MHPAIHAQTYPDKQAVVMASSGAGLTYSELDEASNQAAHAFRTLGLKRGDVVAVVLESTIDVFPIAWGTQRAGLYLTAISTKVSPEDLVYIVRDCGASVLIVSDSLALIAMRAVAMEGAPCSFLVHGAREKFSSWAELANAQPRSPIPDESPGTDMLYSSGTTGRPKGVRPPLPPGPVDGPNSMTGLGQGLYSMGPETIYLSTAPLYHAAPLRWAMTIHRLGGTAVIMDGFDAEQALALIERFRVTHSTWVPTHFVRMLKLPRSVRDAFDLRSHEVAIHAAAPCPKDIKQQMIDWWGPIIYEYYSGTELAGLTAVTSSEWLERPGTVGRAILGQLRICDDEGEELSRGSVGNVYFSDGPPFEYHNDPEKTAAAHNRHGWATLGDIGWVDGEGYLYLTDRKSFMIISGGVNIYPQEIENCLVSHSKVADAAVFGIPDEEMGERVVAIVQPFDWREAGPKLAEELLAWARGSMGGVKCPRQIDFRRDLPREPTGKLMKRHLRNAYLEAARSERSE